MLASALVNKACGHPRKGFWHQLFWTSGPGLRPRRCVTIRRRNDSGRPLPARPASRSAGQRYQVENGDHLSVTTLLCVRAGGVLRRRGVVRDARADPRVSTFTPNQQDVAAMLSDRVHGLDALLRYKESGATVKFAGRDSQKGLDLWMLDLTDKEGNTTRYYISAKTWRVLWLEYEEKPSGDAKPVKFKRTFHDYRAVQGTLVPYRSVLYEGD